MKISDITKYPVNSQYSPFMKGIKKFKRFKYRTLHGHHKWLDFPTTIQLDTQNYCNIKCIYCNPQGSKIPRGTMPMELIEYIFKFFKGYEIDIIRPFLNGDSMLETRLKEIIYLANKYIPYARVDIFTNGVAYENRHLLVDENLDTVRFTFCAASKKMYKHIHGASAYHKALKTIRWFRDHKLSKQKIFINFIIVKDNEDELEAWHKLFAEFDRDVRPLHVGYGQTSSQAVESSVVYQQYLMNKLRPSEERLCCTWQNLSVSWDGYILQCPIVPYECNYGKIEDVDLLNVWKRRMKLGLDNQYCEGCNLKGIGWRKLYDKYLK